MHKKVLVSLRVTMIAQMDVVATREGCNRSELIRSAIREYLYNATIKEGKLNEIRNQARIESSVATKELAVCS